MELTAEELKRVRAWVAGELFPADRSGSVYKAMTDTELVSLVRKLLAAAEENERLRATAREGIRGDLAKMMEEYRKERDTINELHDENERLRAAIVKHEEGWNNYDGSLVLDFNERLWKNVK